VNVTAQFNEEIHAPIRLRVCAMLAAAESVEFAILRQAIGVTDSVLSKHLARLEAAGYVSIAKGPAFGHLRTWVALTKAGRQAVASHLAALRELAEQITDALIDAVRDYGITAPVYLSQNDGTLMDIDYTRQYPVATFASGPTNSMRGAATLSGLGDCVVIDIGGTTSDIGVLGKGFPREATGEVTVAGVRTNFRMPDVLSIGIGGGSHVEDAGLKVGPTSVGYQLTERALVFGGSEFTATDAAVACGYAVIGDPALVARLDESQARAALATVAQAVTGAVERMRISAEPLPVVAVGGGSILLPEELPGLGPVHRPEHFAVANAIGAAIAQVSGEVDRVYAIPDGQRERIVEEAKAEAIDKAVAAGANPSDVHVVDFDEVPLPYVPGNATRIRVKAVGELALEAVR
jgi:N-methylhydantoinase A/oxoprolinase/acetone carboxylase beta subunit